MMGSSKVPEVHSAAQLPVTDTLRSTRTCHMLYAHRRRLLNQALQIFSKCFTNNSLIDDIFLLKAQPAQLDFITGVNSIKRI